MAIAPASCSCGEPIGLVHETADRDSNGSAVWVGKLVCAAGHSWIDIRALGEDRPHVKAPKAWQRKDLTMAKPEALHKYHVILTEPDAEGSFEHDITGTDLRTVDGTLIVERGDKGEVRMYAPGTWKLAELERVDDRKV